MKHYFFIFFIGSALYSSAQDQPLQKGSDAVLAQSARIGDYIKFNIEAGGIINNSFSNVPGKTNPSSRTTAESYTRNLKSRVNGGFSLGFNFLFGKSRYVKPGIGVNYLHSEGKFVYGYREGGFTSSTTDLSCTSKVDFINFVTGISFIIADRIHIEPRIAYNYVAKADVRMSGTVTTQTISPGPVPFVSDMETITYNSEPSANKHIESTISFCPKISYEFKLKEQKFGVYASYNMAYQYRLPWWMLGIAWYPFKKLM